MAKKFKDLGSLFSHLNKQITSSLGDNVAKRATKVMQEEIEDEVYSTYKPVQYERQLYSGGLIDEKNISTKLEDSTLIVENVRSDYDEHGNFRNVAHIVETGEGYQYPVPPSLTEGRPFTQATRERLKDGEALDALQKGLRQRGIDVEKRK